MTSYVFVKKIDINKFQVPSFKANNTAVDRCVMRSFIRTFVTPINSRFPGHVVRQTAVSIHLLCYNQCTHSVEEESLTVVAVMRNSCLWPYRDVGDRSTVFLKTKSHVSQ